MARKWFQLKRDDGSDLTSATSVVVDVEDVDTFRKAVKEEYKDSDLAGIAASNLAVFDANGVAMAPRDSLAHIDETGTLIVQVPQRAEIALSTPAIDLLQVILPHILANAPTTLTERDGTFKERLCDCYGCFRRKKTWVRCMLLDVAFPRSLVIVSHLFRRSNEYLSLAMMQISDIDDAKNGLLLFKPLEYALDHFQISFIRDDSDVFRLKLFDPSIKDTRIIDLKDRKGHDVLTTEQQECFSTAYRGRRKHAPSTWRRHLVTWLASLWYSPV